MELLLSQLLPTFIYPLGAAILLLLLSVLFVRSRGPATFIEVLVLAGLWLASTPLFAHFLVSTLEWRHLARPVDELSAADAIVVLGGGLGRPDLPRHRIELEDGADRVWHAAELYRSGKAPLVIASGGTREEGEPPEAELMAALLETWGVAPGDIWLETGSETTRENAANTAKLIAGRPIDKVYLVTSAVHMPRALAAFRTVGIDAVPTPTDYTALQSGDIGLLDYLPDAEALQATTAAVHEYLGMAYYRWRGWIDLEAMVER